MNMSKPVCLLFVLVILTTILCYNSVCSQMGSWGPVSACGCEINPNGSVRCAKRVISKTSYKYKAAVKCICRNPIKDLNEDYRKQFEWMCNSESKRFSIPL